MDGYKIINLLNESESLEPFEAQCAEIIESTIDISGKTLPLRIRVTDEPAKLADIVPLAQVIGDKICSTLMDNLAANGQPVQCRKGCCACCSYLVALSLPEVYYLQQTFSTIPAECRVPIIYDCIDSAKKILDVNALKKYNIETGNDMSDISKWYSQLNLKCPFLSVGSCGIYAQRPLACREHMAITPPELCKSGKHQTPEIVDMPISMTEVLGQLAAELEQTEEIEAVILPLALTCMDHYMARLHDTWPAVDMVKRFIRILESSASKHLKSLATQK